MLIYHSVSFALVLPNSASILQGLSDPRHWPTFLFPAVLVVPPGLKLMLIFISPNWLVLYSLLDLKATLSGFASCRDDAIGGSSDPIVTKATVG
jgi:hypothetical protein